eukprot:3931787-Rhodomonas_salina.2
MRGTKKRQRKAFDVGAWTCGHEGREQRGAHQILPPDPSSAPLVACQTLSPNRKSHGHVGVGERDLSDDARRHRPREGWDHERVMLVGPLQAVVVRMRFVERLPRFRNAVRFAAASSYQHGKRRCKTHAGLWPWEVCEWHPE